MRNIIPFCIYHYIDQKTKTYFGYIGNSSKIKNEDGKILYYCHMEPQQYRGWKLAGQFYAVSPSLRPIPTGMQLYCAKRTLSFPYDISDINIVYDMFNVKDYCLYFITYYKPVPNTKPLYFHKIGKHVFPSFDSEPPPGWEKDLSPVYVMTMDTVGDLNYSKIKFNCNNGRCLPWSKDIRDVYDLNPHKYFPSLNECILGCNELIPSEKRQHLSLLETIKQQTTKNKVDIPNIFKKLSPIAIGVAIALLIVILFIVIYLVVKNKIEISKRYR